MLATAGFRARASGPILVWRTRFLASCLIDTLGLDFLAQTQKEHRRLQTASNRLTPSPLGRTPGGRFQDIVVRIGSPAFGARLVARWATEKRLAPLRAGMRGTRFTTGRATRDGWIDFGRNNLMVGYGKEPRRCCG